MGKDKRFEIITKEGSGLSTEVCVLKDRETGVQYLTWRCGYSGGITPLLDKDGKPVIGNIYN